MRSKISPTICWILAFFFVVLNVGIAFASLYPTQPIESTEFSAGQLALITWKDDNHRPHLEDMGHVWIKLYDADDAYVATLAKHVSPTAYSQSVFIPTGLPKSSHYYLSFSSKEPHMTAYTADFTITPYSYLFPADMKLGNKTTTPHSNRTIDASSSITATNKTTLTSPASESPSATAARADQSGSNPSHGNTNNNLRKGGGTKINLESHQFGVVVLWPALIGIFMAI